jgi:uncharacterized protein
MDSATHPPSPCTSVCELDTTSDICLGCGRLLDEIARWGAMSAEEKWEVLRRAEARGFPREGDTGGS